MADRPDLATYVNGEFMPLSRAVETMKGMSFESAGGFYDAERTFGGQVFKLRQHLERLYRGLDHSGMDAGMTVDELESITNQLLDLNRPMLQPGQDYAVTQVVSLDPNRAVGDTTSVNVVVYCQFIDFTEFAGGYLKGVRIVTPSTYAIVKRDDQRTYPLMNDAEGNITECTGANFMFVSGGRIKLPNRRNVLPGVSMSTVLELAADQGIPVDEDDYSAHDVYMADEAFVTSTRICMQPVATMNGLDMGDGVPGPFSLGLLDRWREKVGFDFVKQALENLPV